MRPAKIPEAIEAYRRAISIRPNYYEALNNLANVLMIEGKLEEAVATYHQSLAVRPDFAPAAANLGNTLRKLGQIDDAIAWLRRAVAMEPAYRDACRNLAIFLSERGQWTESIAMFRRALYLHNQDMDLEVLLASALRGAGELDESIGVYQRNLARRPGTAWVFRGLAQTHEARGDLADAAVAYARAIKLQQDFIEVMCELGNLQLKLGRVQDALALFNEAIDARPTDPLPYSCRLNALHYVNDTSPAVVFHEHVDWNQKHAQPLNYEILPHDLDRDPNRRLRVAFVSANFRHHAVGIFMESLLAGHDPSQVETIAYADLLRTDATTARLQKLFHQWRNTSGISDQKLSDMIRADKIDILVDLAGHTPGNRLLVFARKPAPIQITYLGYPDTTGLSAMDYCLTDITADPPGMTENYYSEKLLRVPKSFVCYRPPADAPDISALPAKTNGFITFGSFNSLAKINEKVTDLWTRILQAHPNSRLLIKNVGLSDPETRTAFLRRFTSAGIDASRIDLRGKSATLKEHLSAYAEMDIALDTFPYNGLTTSCEAMWMGVPVITLAGQIHASRIGLSLLTNLKLPELAATSEEHYAQLVADLVQDLDALAEIRESFREWMTESPLMHGRRLAWNIEAQIRIAWKAWLAATPIPVEA